MMKTELYTVYSQEGDMTFIMEDTYEGENLKSIEVKGFYFGEPNDIDNFEYYGKVNAEMRK